MTRNITKKLSKNRHEELINILRVRFGKNVIRHEHIDWAHVEDRLNASPEKLWSLNEMEITDGEPDVISYDKEKNEYCFCDCSPESPKGRRSLCYDSDALELRKENKPKDSAMSMAQKMEIEVLTEERYRRLQQLGNFDLKTSSWVVTPANIRGLGGAQFCDRRYDTVFVYHNGAESYYASRGFRACLNV